MLASCPLDSLGFNRRRSDSGLEPPAEELHWFEDPCQLVRPCQAQEPCHVQGPYQDEGPFQAALGPILTAKSYRDEVPWKVVEPCQAWGPWCFEEEPCQAGSPRQALTPCWSEEP